MEVVIKRETGASHVTILGNIVRNAASADKRGTQNPFAGGGNGVNGYASVVHTDFRAEKAAALVEAAGGDRDGRYMLINTWRNISPAHPIYNNTLACCDGTTVAQALAGDVPLPGGKLAEQYRLSSVDAAEHRWYYFPQMQVDELLLFTQFDSDPLAPCRYCFHTAFEDPAVPGNLPPRQSIEVRAIAFFPNYMRNAPISRPIAMTGDVGRAAHRFAYAPIDMEGGADLEGRPDEALDIQDDAQMEAALAASLAVAEEERQLQAVLAASRFDVM